jgi:mono/diheme cytochrome c family protein
VYVPFPVGYALFQFVAAPTTPPPVLVAQDQLPTSTVPAAAPAPKPAPAPPPMPAAPPPAVAALDERLSRIERALALLTGTGLSGPPAQAQGPSGAGVEAPPPVAVGEGEEPPPPPVGAAPQADTRATSYTPPATGGTRQGGSPGGVASLAAVAQLMQTRCAACHTSPGRDGVDLFDSSGAWRPNVSRAEILRSVRGDRMPRSPVKLSSSEKALVEAWAREGQ